MSPTTSNTAISIYGNEIHSVFELLGKKENDITYSLGWATVLRKADQFPGLT